MAANAEIRRRFMRSLWEGLRIVWPILSVLVAAKLACGAVIGLLEGWSVGDAIYFTFVTALTIGYGDLVPKLLASRLLALTIGFIGILLIALVAAIGVQALQDATKDQ
jgi:Ion channel